MNRTAKIRRETGETQIEVQINLDGHGSADISTGIGFFDHMLSALARHARCDLTVRAIGDLQVDEHHTVEDVAITLGRALGEALGERAGIARMGHAIVPMDEALALVAVDLGGRGYCVFEADFDTPRVGSMATGLVGHFFQSLATEGRLNLHARLLAPTPSGLAPTGSGRADADDHHRVEALFKALARALHQATRLDPTLGGAVPSTKRVVET
jgi:imidazoleglycerol-phosphate dehydratase